MKSLIIKTILATSISAAAVSLAQAHGSKAIQAGEALKVVVADVQKNVSREDMRLFQSIKAELTGHEQFAVTVQFSDQRQLTYQCNENEEVEPAVWVCKQN